ncbi:MAG: hypothetical protein GY893_12845 [bacterium]|nr:hypothetical protein [bacterium]
MSTKDELIKLFKSNFDSNGNWEEKHTCPKFNCPNSHDCYITENEPKYTPYFGEENTPVMCIGEAPSITGGKGPWIGGNFSTLPKENNSPIHLVKEFCKENYNTTPYFTDLSKCGLEKQEKKSRLKQRFTNCAKMFLKEEIKLVKPQVILCFGTTTFDFVVDHKTELEIPKETYIYYLLHYTKQAMLTLSKAEKKDIIWKIQSGLDPEKKLLSNLSKFLENRNRNI